jgi:hypothetical protein
MVVSSKTATMSILWRCGALQRMAVARRGPAMRGSRHFSAAGRRPDGSARLSEVSICSRGRPRAAQRRSSAASKRARECRRVRKSVEECARASNSVYEQGRPTRPLLSGCADRFAAGAQDVAGQWIHTMNLPTHDAGHLHIDVRILGHIVGNECLDAQPRVRTLVDETAHAANKPDAGYLRFDVHQKSDARELIGRRHRRPCRSCNRPDAAAHRGDNSQSRYARHGFRLDRRRAMSALSCPCPGSDRPEASSRVTARY